MKRRKPKIVRTFQVSMGADPVAVPAEANSKSTGQANIVLYDDDSIQGKFTWDLSAEVSFFFTHPPPPFSFLSLMQLSHTLR